MKEFLKKNIYILIIIILIIIIIIACRPLAFKENNEVKNNSEESYEQSYEQLAENFMTSMFDSKKMAEFLVTGFDYQGILAWQNISGNIESFKEEYAKLENNTTKKKDFRDRMIQLAYENEYDLGQFRLVGITKIKDQADIYIFNVKDTVAFPGESRDLEEFILTFYKNKIINIEILDSEKGTSESMFAEYRTKNQLKTSGHYIDKEYEDYWEVYSFEPDGTVLNEYILCPEAMKLGYGCEKSEADTKGEYIIKDDKIEITLKEIIAVDGWQKLDEEIKVELSLESDNTLKYKDSTFNWQADYKEV